MAIYRPNLVLVQLLERVPLVLPPLVFDDLLAPVAAGEEAVALGHLVAVLEVGT